MELRSRPAAVAGYFYPSEKSALLNEIRSCFANQSIGPGTRIGSVPNPSAGEARSSKEPLFDCLIVPHAGYQYSGPVAAHSYLKVETFMSVAKGKLTVIILGPNHYGLGSGVALSPSSEWETPLGSLKVNQSISEEIRNNSDVIDIDPLAHSREHSIEVQIPFLQTIADPERVSIVPISLMLQDRSTAKDVAESVFKAIKSTKTDNSSFLILGSSDLTHYEPQKKANEQDAKLIREIRLLDVNSYYSALERNNISACGYGAIAITMLVAQKLGKTRGNLLKYATSGDITGDKDSVVGYCAVHFD